MGNIGKNLGTGVYGKPNIVQPSTSPKKRVVVFAETPDTYYGIGDPSQFMPKELSQIASDYQKLKLEPGYVNTEQMFKESNDFNKRNPSPEQRYKFNEYQTKKYTNPKYVSYIQERDRLESSFDIERNKLGNPTYLRKEFLSEAENVKQFYAKDPNVQVDIVPWYEGGTTKQSGLKEMKSKLSELNANDDVVIFGHSGDKLGGIKNQDIAKSLSESAVKNVYLGSCAFDKHINEGFSESGKNVYYRDNERWLGFNPKAKTFIDGMFSRNSTNSQNNLFTYTQGKQGTQFNPITENVQEGVNYKVVHEPQPILKPKQSTSQLWNNSFKPLIRIQ